MIFEFRNKPCLFLEKRMSTNHWVKYEIIFIMSNKQCVAQRFSEPLSDIKIFECPPNDRYHFSFNKEFVKFVKIFDKLSFGTKLVLP